jgi:gliding motility-associated lipoprotein GldD
MMLRWGLPKLILTWTAILTLGISGCAEPPVPKPRGYYRIAYPGHNFASYQHACGFSLDIPVHSKIERIEKEASSVSDASPCWFNCAMPRFNAKVHCTYIPLESKNQFNALVEDAYQMVFTHEMKATGITTQAFEFPERAVSGLMYRLSGPVASSVQFFATDSARHFLRGSLYFNHAPNPDSLKPTLDHVEQDIVRMIESLQWNPQEILPFHDI